MTYIRRCEVCNDEFSSVIPSSVRKRCLTCLFSDVLKDEPEKKLAIRKRIYREKTKEKFRAIEKKPRVVRPPKVKKVKAAKAKVLQPQITFVPMPERPYKAHPFDLTAYNEECRLSAERNK